MIEVAEDFSWDSYSIPYTIKSQLSGVPRTITMPAWESFVGDEYMAQLSN
jgi:hypothetical protein